MTEPVRLNDLERRLNEIDARIVDPRAGLFGPESMHWRVIGQTAVMFGGPRALLMQLAHPAVAHGVSNFSSIHRDPAGRFRKTMQAMYGITFGSRDDAFAIARSLFRLHARVRGAYPKSLGEFSAGAPYSANTQAPLLWVAATLTDSAVCAYEALVAPLSRDEKDQMVGECRDLYGMFGIPASRVPADWAAFQRYVGHQCARFANSVGDDARELATLALNPPSHLARPLFGVARALTARWLPPPLRAPYGFPIAPPMLGTMTERTSRVAFRSPLLPARLRHAPTWFRAQRRLRGDLRPDRLASALSEFATRLVSRPPAE